MLNSAVAVLTEQLRHQKQEVCGCRPAACIGASLSGLLATSAPPLLFLRPFELIPVCYRWCRGLRYWEEALRDGFGLLGRLSPLRGYAMRYSTHKHCVPAVLQGSDSPSLDTMPRMVMAARGPLLLLALATGAWALPTSGDFHSQASTIWSPRPGVHSELS